MQDSKEVNAVSCKVEMLSDEEKCEPKSKKGKKRLRDSAKVKYKEEEDSDQSEDLHSKEVDILLIQHF